MRLVPLFSLLAFLIAAPAPTVASESRSSPVAAVSIGQVIDQVRCNVAQAISSADRQGFILSVASVELTLKLLRSSETRDEFALEIPMFEDEIGVQAISEAGIGDVIRESDHKLVVRFVPDTNTSQQDQSPCFGHLGFMETLQELASVMEDTSQAGFSKVDIDFEADFLVRRRRDDKVGHFWFATDATTANDAAQHVKIDATLDATLAVRRAPPAAASQPSQGRGQPAPPAPACPPAAACPQPSRGLF